MTSRVFDLDLSRFLRLQCFSEHLSLPVVYRGLEVLEAIVDEGRLLTVLRPFLKSDFPQIVSKCVLILGQRCSNLNWMWTVMSDDDDRVRANLVESLWNRRDEEIEPVLCEALKDRYHRVAANAVYALFLAGSDKYTEGLDQLISTDDPAFRRAAVSVARSVATKNHEAAGRIKPLIRDGDESVRRAAFRALVFLREHASEAAGPTESGCGGKAIVPATVVSR